MTIRSIGEGVAGYVRQSREAGYWVINSRLLRIRVDIYIFRYTRRMERNSDTEMPEVNS